MLNILKAKLNSVETQEAHIICNRKINGESMKITLSRKCEESPIDPCDYIGTFIAELRLASEENLDMMSCSFLVRVSMIGYFTINEDKSEITEKRLHTTIMAELLPYVRAYMASLMSISGIPPYMIPNDIIPELS